MTDVEAAALAWLDRHLRVHRCGACNGVWVTRRSIGVLFHECSPPRSTFDWRTPRRRHDDERTEWARSILGDALVDAIEERDGGEVLLREVDE